MAAVKRRKSSPVWIFPARPILIFGARRMTFGFSVQVEYSVALAKPDLGRFGNHLQNAAHILASAPRLHDGVQAIGHWIAPAPFTVQPTLLLRVSRAGLEIHAVG